MKKRRDLERTLFERIARAPTGQRVVAGLMHFTFETARLIGRTAAGRIASDVLREIGPFSTEHGTALANLERAFPDKPPLERAQILSGVYDNLARATIDYAFMREIAAAFDPKRPTGGMIEHVGIENVFAIRDSDRPCIVFGAHYGNWEMAAAIGHRIGVPITALYRPPTNPYVAAEMDRRRTFVNKLVVSGRGAAIQIAGAILNGSHIGIIVDQRISEGVELPFFGRPALSNPIIGILARHYETPVYACRTVRLKGGRFWTEMTPPLEFPRDGKGRIDAEGANLMIHGLVESWIREYPEQWLWLHDRWKL